MSQMWKRHGDRFKCRIPGIWCNSSKEVPVCNHYHTSEPDGALGFESLIADESFMKIK